MKEVILCPFHQEQSPSCVLYHDGYRCFGCGKYGPLEEIGRRTEEMPPPPEPEDLEERFKYISQLPTVEYRGLRLPADSRGAYIIWPGNTYYKKRMFDGKVKYLCPRGHKKPWFVANHLGGDVCILVEGELNALSIAEACPEFSVVSPGSAGDFNAKSVLKVLPFLSTVDKLLLIADKDQAGAQALINAKSVLDTPTKLTRWALVERDANEVLQAEGREALRNEILRILGGEVEARTG